MLRRVDMGAGVVAQHQRHGGRREAVAVRRAHLVVGGERRDDDLRMVRQHRHLVFDVAAEIDQDHGWFQIALARSASLHNSGDGS